MPAREMTYLFVIIALPVMNSILLNSNSFLELAVANIIVIAVLFVLERGWGFHYEISKRITYEKIELIRPENRQLLMDDLQQRTGLDITRIEVGRVNFLRDTAELKIYYDEPNEFDDEYEFLDDPLLAEI